MNELVMENTGYIPFRDKRNFQLEAMQSPVIPPDLHVAKISGLPIFMQGQQPSCVAHSVAWTIMQKIYKETGEIIVLSPRFIYAISKQSDGLPGQDGTTLVNALKVAMKYGACEEKYFPNDVSLSKEEYMDITKISPEAFQNGLTHRIKGYAFLNDLSESGLKNAIFQNDIVMVGMDIDKNWWTDVNGVITWEADKVLPIRPPRPATSRHLVSLYSYNTIPVIHALMNWWSKDWASDGTGFFKSNELPYIYEAAVLL